MIIYSFINNQLMCFSSILLITGLSSIATKRKELTDSGYIGLWTYFWTRCSFTFLFILKFWIKC